MKPSYAITPPPCDHFYPFCLQSPPFLPSSCQFCCGDCSIYCHPQRIHVASVHYFTTIYTYTYFFFSQTSPFFFFSPHSHFSLDMLPMKSIFCSLITSPLSSSSSSRNITARYAALGKCFCMDHISYVVRVSCT